MTRFVLPLLALLTLGAFLGILLWEVPRLDLALVLGATMALVIADLVASWRDPR